MTTLKHRNNVRLVNGEIIKNGSKFDCVICKTSLSKYSVDQLLKTKMHLDKFGGKDLRSSLTDKDITADDNNNRAGEDNNITGGYCNICNTRYNNKNEHNETEEQKNKY